MSPLPTGKTRKPDDLVLTVNGKEHDGWKQCSLGWGLEGLAQTFGVTFADRWTAQAEPFPIREGDEVEISIGDELLLTGYVDDFQCEESTADATLSVSGRSKTADLVDCSAELAAVAGRTMQQLAEALCEPFGIEVTVTDRALATDPEFIKPVEFFVPEAGETPFELLTQLARQRGVLLLTTPKGELEITRAGVERIPGAEIRFGKNARSRSFGASTRDRFSRYTVKGQMPGSDQWNGRASGLIVSSVEDDEVPRHRPLVLRSDEPAAQDYLKKRATWERNTRAGRAERFSYALQGWRHTPPSATATANQIAVAAATGLGTVWRPNRQVKVVDPRFGVDDYLLITNVELSRSLSGGTITRVDVLAREAYDVLKQPEPKRKKRRGRGKQSALAKALAGT